MKNIIALDIGGTSIKSAIVNSNGIFLENSCNIISINSNKDRDYILNKFIHPIKENIKLLNTTKNSFDGIAVSICGPFDYAKGICLIKNLDKYESIYKQNIKKIIQEKLSISYDIPFVFDPDAWSFGRGEVCFNDYENYKKIIVFTMGTGIGSCFIDNKKVVSKGKGVPWFGWISGQEYKNGILNDFTSSIYMQNLYFKKTNEKIDIKTMAERARNNDQIAKYIFNEMGNTLGFFLKKNFVEEFKTECIIFGGQISLSADLFIDKIKYHLKDCTCIKKITKAKDIQFAALKGAAQILLNDNYKYV